MKNFNTFIMEEKEPFYKVEKAIPKKSLLDVHIQAEKDRKSKRVYGNNEKGISIPDRELQYSKVHLGKTKLEGWGESFPSIESIHNISNATKNAHGRAIDRVNELLAEGGHAPVSVKGVHVIYNPHRTSIYLSNGTHDIGMVYNIGKSNGAGFRGLVTPNAPSRQIKFTRFDQRDEHIVDPAPNFNQREYFDNIIKKDPSNKKHHHYVVNKGTEAQKIAIAPYADGAYAQQLAYQGSNAIKDVLLHHDSEFVRATIARGGTDSHREKLLNDPSIYVRQMIALCGNEHHKAYIVAHDPDERNRRIAQGLPV